MDIDWLRLPPLADEVKSASARSVSGTSKSLDISCCHTQNKNEQNEDTH